MVVRPVQLQIALRASFASLLLLAPDMMTQWGGTGFHCRSEGKRHASLIRDVKIAIGFGRLRRGWFGLLGHAAFALPLSLSSGWCVVLQ